MWDREKILNGANDTHFDGHQSFSVELLKLFKKYLQTRIVLKSDSVTYKVIESLEKVMEKFIESLGIYRAEKGTNSVVPGLFCR